jgi:phage head maturation protease
MNGALIELRQASPDKLVLRGYASVSERWYPVGSMFEEKVNTGTWRRGLGQGPDTVLVADHSGLAFARTKVPNGKPTLLLSETDRGLFAEAFLDATAPRVQDLRSTSENCGLQMSVGFFCTRDNWNEDRSRRELLEASTHRGDVTVTNFGANSAAAATISARGEAGEAERRAYAETLKGSHERRMCPDFAAEALSTRGRSQIFVERGELDLARAKLRLRGGRARPAPSRRRSARNGNDNDADDLEGACATCSGSGRCPDCEGAGVAGTAEAGGQPA